ncbi:MAG TPA: SsrA-binding protein SmpB [Patescibacteria group bacterium]|nr:SsrA-binding protein SmpB [Patescibacteria group bacterium]
MVIYNKKAKFNYKLFETFEAGIVLSGSEAKSIRTHRIDLSNSYAKIIQNEVFLINANVPIPGKKDYDSTRTRKLLLHTREITSIQSKIKANKLTLVPVKLYNTGHLFKLQLALAKAKRKFEKKDSIKKKDIEREISSQYKSSV